MHEEKIPSCQRGLADRPLTRINRRDDSGDHAPILCLESVESTGIIRYLRHSQIRVQISDDIPELDFDQGGGGCGRASVGRHGSEHYNDINMLVIEQLSASCHDNLLNYKVLRN
jgi:hypothetical protein